MHLWSSRNIHDQSSIPKSPLSHHHLPAEEESKTYCATALISSSSSTFPQAGMAPFPFVTCEKTQTLIICNDREMLALTALMNDEDDGKS